MNRVVNYYSGRSFNHTRAWMNSAQLIKHIEQNDQVKWFKYESLLDFEMKIKMRLDHFQLESSSEIIMKCLKAPVVGRSFGKKIKMQSKPNWSPDFDKSKYEFTGKWKHWGFIKKSVFKNIAGQTLIALSYEKNSSW